MTVPNTLATFVYTFLALSLFTATPGVVAAEVRYPDNPYIGRSDIFISFDGVHAYARDDLQKQWSALLGEHTFEPVVHQHRLLVGSSAGLYALHIQDGSVIWHVESNNEIFTPVIVNGIAYAGSRNGTLYAFDATSGHERWRTKFPGWVYSPAFASETLITGGQDATLWALDPSNGDQRWSRKLPGELVFRLVPGTPTTVLATTFAADLIAYDASSGKQRWRLQTRAANMPPTVSGNRIFMAGIDGSLRRIGLDSGRLDWEAHFPGHLSSPRSVDGNQVLVSSDEGAVFLLSGEDGITLGEAHFEGEAVGIPFVRRGNVVQFFQNSGQLSIVATAEISVEYSAED